MSAGRDQVPAVMDGQMQRDQLSPKAQKFAMLLDQGRYRPIADRLAMLRVCEDFARDDNSEAAVDFLGNVRNALGLLN